MLWNNLFHISGTDIVRCLSFRFQAFGRPVKNSKKFEEGIFSDLRNLKSGTDATLEEPKSPFLDFLYKNNCIRTQKKQKVFYWYSVPHDRLFLDALERDLKREKMGQEATTVAVSEPALSFQFDSSQSLYEQLTKAQQANSSSFNPQPLSFSQQDTSSVVAPVDSMPPPQMMPQQIPQALPQSMPPMSQAMTPMSDALESVTSYGSMAMTPNVSQSQGTLWRFAGDTDCFGFGEAFGGCNSGVADLEARGAMLLRLPWVGRLAGVVASCCCCCCSSSSSSSSWSCAAEVVVVAVVVDDAAVAVDTVVATVWSGSNTSLVSAAAGAGVALFLGGRPRRLGAGGAACGGVGAGASDLFRPDVVRRTPLEAGVGVKSSPLSSAIWGASGMSSSEDSTMAVRRVARRDGRVDMIVEGEGGYLNGNGKREKKR